MAVNLSPIWGAGAQLLDNSGNVLSGGKIYTYAAGTTTPAATYTSSNGITANSNPIILNSAGRVPYEIWLTDGISYKFVLKDSNDTLIATYDNLSGINSNFIAYTAQQEIQTATAGQTVFNLTTMQYQPGTNNLAVYVDGVNQYGPGAQYAFVETDSDTVTFVSGLHEGASVKFTTATPVASAATDAENVSYTPPFTGAVGTNVEDKLAQYISVKDFGAVGDGITDDTAAIQNAIDEAFSTGQFVYVNAGTYATTGIKIYPNTILQFDANATLKLTANGFAIRTSTSPSVTIPNTSVRFAKIYNAQIDMDSHTGAGIFFEGAQSSVIENAYIYNVGSGTFTYNDGVTNNSNYRTSAIMIKGITGVAGPYYNQVNHCRANGGGASNTNSGIWLGTTIGSTDNQRANLNQINQCVFTSFGEGISLLNGSDNRFVQPEVSSCGTGVVVGNPSIITLNSNGNQFYQIYAESCTTGVNLTTASLDTTIFGFGSLSGTTTGLTDNGKRTYVAELRGTSQITNTPRSYLGGFYLPNIGTATAGTSVSELMNYYDTGTFTPVLADDQSSGNVATALHAYGLYTRIGNRVFVTISFTDINTTGMTAGNQTFIRGLPWDVNNNTLLRSAAAVSFGLISTATGSITARAINGADYISMVEQTTTGQSPLLVSQYTSGAADLYIELSYQV